MIEHVCVFSKKHIEKQKLQNIRIRIMRSSIINLICIMDKLIQKLSYRLTNLRIT